MRLVQLASTDSLTLYWYQGCQSFFVVFISLFLRDIQYLTGVPEEAKGSLWAKYVQRC